MKICRLGHVYDETKHEGCPMCGFEPKQADELGQDGEKDEETPKD